MSFPVKTILVIICVILGGIIGFQQVRAEYEYSNAIGSYWELGVKASTLQQKTAYLDKYVAALEAAKLAPNNAVIFTTPNNSVEQNMVALKSLQGRMHQIQGMDEQSFAYQTAISQITAQEQGEAANLTETFQGAWLLENHSMLWGWHVGILWLGIVSTAAICAIIGLVTL